MEGVIIYKGKYGATSQYAEWLGEELILPVYSATEIQGEALVKYDYFIIGSSVYIGKLQIQNWLRNNLHYINSKKIFFFQVAATPIGEIEKRQSYNQAGVPQDLIENCAFYFLPGKMVMNKLSWKDRLLLRMGAMLAKNAAEKKVMLNDYDKIDKSNIRDMLNDIRKYIG